MAKLTSTDLPPSEGLGQGKHLGKGEVLQQAGSDFRHLAKATYYVSNDQTSARLNEIRPKFYDPKRPPAASKALVRGVGVAGTGISIDMIGVVVQQK